MLAIAFGGGLLTLAGNVVLRPMVERSWQVWSLQVASEGPHSGLAFLEPTDQKLSDAQRDELSKWCNDIFQITLFRDAAMQLYYRVPEVGMTASSDLEKLHVSSKLPLVEEANGSDAFIVDCNTFEYSFNGAFMWWQVASFWKTMKLKLYPG